MWLHTDQRVLSRHLNLSKWNTFRATIHSVKLNIKLQFCERMRDHIYVSTKTCSKVKWCAVSKNINCLPAKRVNNHLKVSELNVSAEPGVTHRLPSDSDSTLLSEVKGWYRHLFFWTYQMWGSILVEQYLYLVKFQPHLLWRQQIETSYRAIVRVRREERNWSVACCHVCLPQAHAVAP